MSIPLDTYHNTKIFLYNAVHQTQNARPVPRQLTWPHQQRAKGACVWSLEQLCHPTFPALLSAQGPSSMVGHSQRGKGQLCEGLSQGWHASASLCCSTPQQTQPSPQGPASSLPIEQLGRGRTSKDSHQGGFRKREASKKSHLPSLCH